MDRAFYENLNKKLLGRPRLSRFLVISNKAITLAVFASYPALLAYSALRGQLTWDLVAVPGAAFCILSAFRASISSPRPYEKYDVIALNKKQTCGKSFPSRHVFSCFMIAMTFQAAGLTAAAAVVGAAAVLLAVLRVCLGVHFVGDVLAGAVIALVIGGVWCSLI